MDGYFKSVAKISSCYMYLQRGFITFDGECIEICDSDGECSREVIRLEIGRHERQGGGFS